MKATTLLLTAMLALTMRPFAMSNDDPAKGPGEGKPGESKPAPLPKCPVMDEPINFLVSTMTKDGPVYFCCDMCITKSKKDPQKYAEKVLKQRKELATRERVQVACPISGESIDKKVFTGDGKDRVYFCCKDCIKKYTENPAKYAEKLATSYTYQTRCPVMGGKIDPTVSAKLPTGERIYFCCRGCDKKLLKNPRKYAENLEKQGIFIDVEKIEQASKEKSKS